MTYPQNKLITEVADQRHDACCAKEFCRACGAHVSGYNANSPLVRMRPEAKGWDYWAACDNAACEHAYGEGFFQNNPDWVETRP
jgi:hypothetical protein